MSGTMYIPRPGSVAFRALAYLEQLDGGKGEASTAVLSEALGVPCNNLKSCLEPALVAGAVFRRQKDPRHLRSPMFWSLSDLGGLPRPVVPPPGPQTPVAPVATVAPPAGPAPAGRAVVEERLADEGRASAAGASGAPGAPGAPQPSARRGAAPALRCALWSDGWLVLERPGGVRLRFSPEESAVLTAYLRRGV